MKKEFEDLIRERLTDEGLSGRTPIWIFLREYYGGRWRWTISIDARGGGPPMRRHWGEKTFATWQEVGRDAWAALPAVLSDDEAKTGVLLAIEIDPFT